MAVKKWFNSLSELRGKERSFLYGDYYHLHSSPTSLAYLRLWDQSERYVTAVNWGSEPASITLNPPGKILNIKWTRELFGRPGGEGILVPFLFNAIIFLPAAGVELADTGKVKLSSDPDLKADSSVSLDNITVGPGNGVLLQFPYAG